MSQELGVSVKELYDEFLDEICGTEIVWGLANEEGWAVCDSNDFDGREAIPFWSNEHLAKLLCTGDWADYVPRPIPLEEFLDDWLHGMHEDEILVGTNWDDELVGPELEPLVILEDVLDEDD
ncbi:DUF2750 domain-containing protein [Aliikangiella marina]|uniref:DUF2750 domain-containing protein n=1 Tax=Aliikangiella marina TaxID=1712262 RepID=A0A545TJV1_9GAMM|nr:DUF2750 domain-containing protein [Aliikangiella marina]TQV77441.1 DUF2750 domain-containing protein [Aliikangiella marina]